MGKILGKHTLASVCLALLLSPLGASAADPAPVACTGAEVTHIVDGDTIDVEADGTAYRVRYIGIGPIENMGRCAQESS